eukprot:5270708-Pyramimonas_sp.AAC.1
MLSDAALGTLVDVLMALLATVENPLSTGRPSRPNGDATNAARTSSTSLSARSRSLRLRDPGPP